MSALIGLDKRAPARRECAHSRMIEHQIEQKRTEANAKAEAFPEQRKQRILEVLARNQAVAVAQLAQSLEVSEASIRRDLQQLEQAGLLRRTHGGAVSNHISTFEPSLAEKEVQLKAEKQAIARVAVDLIEEGDTVMLDAGSTTLQMARQWRRTHNVTVVTDALNIAWELAAAGVEIVVTGGNLRALTLSLVGPIAEGSLAGLHVNKLFLAANGIDLQAGLTTPNLAEAQTKKAMMRSAREIILVADHSKVGRVAFAQICGLDKVHCLITDPGTPADFLAGAEKLGVRVLLAGGDRERQGQPRPGRAVKP